MASMPGYELTEPWLTEEGLPKKGIWDVVYYAGEGKGEKGCKPMPKLRRALLQLVICDGVCLCICWLCTVVAVMVRAVLRVCDESLNFWMCDAFLLHYVHPSPLTTPAHLYLTGVHRRVRRAERSRQGGERSPFIVRRDLHDG